MTFSRNTADETELAAYNGIRTLWVCLHSFSNIAPLGTTHCQGLCTSQPAFWLFIPNWRFILSILLVVRETATGDYILLHPRPGAFRKGAHRILPLSNCLFPLQPDIGGDTLFLSQVEAYKRLSPDFQKRLEGLRALHSAVRQAEFAERQGRPVRREPVETEASSSLSRHLDVFTMEVYLTTTPLTTFNVQHPLVRQHPVTGEKALYVNQGFTRRIVGYKTEESDYLLNFLFDHISKGADFHIRASYAPGTVVVWVSPSPWTFFCIKFLVLFLIVPFLLSFCEEQVMGCLRELGLYVIILPFFFIVRF